MRGKYYHCDEGCQTGTDLGRKLGAETFPTGTGALKAKVSSYTGSSHIVVESVKKTHGSFELTGEV